MGKVFALTAAGLIGAAAPAIAGPDIDDCISIAESAGVVMEIRQEGLLTLGDVLTHLQNETDPGGVGIIREMALQAYDSPRFNSAEYKSEAIAEFANTWLIACMGVMDDV